MADKKKSARLSMTRDLGAVTKKLPSGMFETAKGDKIPALPGVTIGTKLKLEAGKFVITGGKEEKATSMEDVDRASVARLQEENAALKARLDKLESFLGEKGGAAKATTTPPKTGTTPPKTGTTPPKTGGE